MDESGSGGRPVDDKPPKNAPRSSSSKRAKLARYGADSITLLESWEAVRLRPAMYIGSTGELGLHYLVCSVARRAVGDAMSGSCDRIDVTIHGDNSITVTDKGLGIPVDIEPRSNKAKAELIMTVLFGGPEPGRNVYTLPDVGLLPVNSLSEWCRLTVSRDGGIYQQEYLRGAPRAPLRRTGDTENHGTEISFKPDHEIFTVLEFSLDRVCADLRQLAFLNSGLRVTVTDERSTTKREFFYPDGLAGFLKEMNSAEQVINAEPIHFKKTATESEPLQIEVAIQYTEGGGEAIHSFANQRGTPEGGAHVSGLRAGLARATSEYARRVGLLRDVDEGPAEVNPQRGLAAVIGVALPQPRFAGPTYGRMVSDIADAVERFVAENVDKYLTENPSIARQIVEGAVDRSIRRDTR